MNIDINVLNKRLGERFANSEIIGNSLLRFSKLYAGRPYAVYYIDLGGRLAEKAAALSRYQDDILGPLYFTGEKSLQWNNYLCLIATQEELKNPENQKAKNLIECDRAYARKFVITENELDSFIDAHVAKPTDIDPSANVLSLWSEKFRAEGIEQAVFSEDDLPARIKLIESSEPKVAKKKSSKLIRKDGNTHQFLKGIFLQNFRRSPEPRSFKFGKVNLIYGVNGTGKTSLFEAIEFFYCGRNKRNLEDPATKKWKVQAVFADGQQEVAEASPISTFRQRNLEWYGQPEIRTNNLCQSFGRFNFFDTDAAVAFVFEGPESSLVEEHLSKLLVSPDASQIWRNIERLYGKVIEVRKDVRLRNLELNQDLSEVKQKILNVGKIKKDSDLVAKRLREVLDELSWNTSEIENNVLPETLIGPASESLAILEQALSLRWITSPVSLKSLKSFNQKISLLVKQIEPIAEQAARIQKAEKAVVTTSKECSQAIRLVQEARRIIASGVIVRQAELEEKQRTIYTYLELFMSDDWSDFKPILLDHKEVSLSRLRQRTNKASEETSRSLAELKSQSAGFQNLLDASNILAQELRQAANRILAQSQLHDECPLCHTHLQPGELERRMKRGVDEKLETQGQSILNQLRKAEKAANSATLANRAVDWLDRFYIVAKLQKTVLVERAIETVDTSKSVFSHAQSRTRTLKKEISDLAGQGFSIERLEELTEELKQAGYALRFSDSGSIDELEAKIVKKLESSTEQGRTYSIQRKELESQINQLLKNSASIDCDSPESLPELKQQLAVTKNIQEQLEAQDISYWPSDTPIVEVISQLSKVRTMASDLQSALGRELQASSEKSDLEKRKITLEKSLSSSSLRLKRLVQVEAVFSDVCDNHSLTKSMQTTIEENRDNIDSIFRRIHTPSDFQGLGQKIATLIRKLDKDIAQLTQVSTGQRAAYVLSIFLALNSRLKHAPPLILIDDPIAHVDDLNTLSFLDYLRDVAISGTRQIFFTTANEKIAALFERKFDFLGADDFKRINLPPRSG